MKISNSTLNKYIKIKRKQNPQILIEDYYNVATEEILAMISEATKIYTGFITPSQSVDIYVNNPFVFVVTQYTDVIMDIVLIDLALNSDFNDSYITETLNELLLITQTIERVTIENAKKDIINEQNIDEKNEQIRLLKEQIKVLENERENYLLDIQFNANEIVELNENYKRVIRKFTGINVL